jgi:hypothetical protein
MALVGYCNYAVIYRRSPVGLPAPKVLTDAKLIFGGVIGGPINVFIANTFDTTYKPDPAQVAKPSAVRGADLGKAPAPPASIAELWRRGAWKADMVTSLRFGRSGRIRHPAKDAALARTRDGPGQIGDFRHSVKRRFDETLTIEIGFKYLRFFADCAAKKGPLRGSLNSRP